MPAYSNCDLAQALCTAVERLIAVEAAVDNIEPSVPGGICITTQSELVYEALGDSLKVLQICADLTITTGIVIPPTCTVKVDGHKFIQGGGGSLRFRGPLISQRQKIFESFVDGEIFGPFGGYAIPEWWGLTAGRHDLAINSAVKASWALETGGQIGHTVLLMARRYDIARPIDLSNTKCELLGRGSGVTSIWSTADFKHNETDDWAIAEVTTPTGNWLENPVTGQAGNHSALVWMGAVIPQDPRPSTFWSRVRGVHLDCYYASVNNPLRYFSGISSLGWVEEQSSIIDVVVTHFSGLGIGFPRHQYNGSYGAAVINGLRVANIWITTGMKRDAFGIYTTQWCNNASFSDITIDCSLRKSASSEYNIVGTGDDTQTYDMPDHILYYPWVGIKAQGTVTFNRFHIEGTCIGIWCADSDVGSVVINGLNCYGLMDIQNGAVYYNDGRSYLNTTGQVGNEQPPANTNYYRWSCAVLIAGPHEFGRDANGNTNFSGKVNRRDRVVINGLRASYCSYALRDSTFGKEVACRGHSAPPNAGGVHIPDVSISLYSRGNSYIRSAVYPYSLIGEYDPAAPNTSRLFFLGPVY